MTHQDPAAYHASQARKNLHEAEAGGDLEIAAGFASCATAHAMIALVEEQRTANLIAALASTKAGLVAGIHTAEQVFPLIVDLNNQVTARLGLTPSTTQEKS